MKFVKKAIVVLLIVAVVAGVTACANGKDAVKFDTWNECTALTSLKEYVKAVTDKNSKEYIPVEDRIAVFDMDGTLCGELFPEYLEYLLLAYRCLDDPTYQASEDLVEVATEIREAGKNYKTPAIPEYDVRHGKAQAKAFAGMTPNEFIQYVKTFLQQDAQGFTGLKYADSIYKPMIEVVTYLQQNDFTCYVVSGSDRMICRAVACEALNLPENQIIGMDVTLVATNEPTYENNEGYHYNNLHYQFNDGGKDTLVRGDSLWIKNLKMNKVFQIAQEIGKQPVLSFGNSSGDVSMHEYTVTDNKYRSMAFMLIADDAERDHADLTETAKRKAQWETRGYTIISMKNDFKTIYGEGVTMTK
ncbi:MAG: haloacid dehalogenase-like hydrolase [Clostridia bacterium]|nr:haloacid dehalogenase-like hydrolase [Clostridia bacterium]